ncbi:MAG: metallophosphoesterase [Candidatus Hydrogenedentales bacterium]
MKKILLLSDIHGRGDMAAAIIAGHPDLDYVLIAGDITNFGDVKSAEAVIDALCSDGKRRCVYLVAGNCDPLSVRTFFRAEGFETEGHARELPFASFVGVGGGLRRAGLTSFERTESELNEALTSQLSSLIAKDRKKPVVVLTHTPPYGTNADRHGEMHVGSREFAKAMVEYGPDVWICGHIHESRCVSLEDGTLVINPGPCSCGSHAVLEISESPDERKLVRASLFR